MIRVVLVWCALTGWLTAFAGAARADFEASIGTGIGAERLNWSIAATGGSPNVLSELKFLRTTTVVDFLRLAWSDGDWRVVAQGDVGLMTQGKAIDEDFTANNRQGLSARALAQIHGNMLWAFRGGVEYRWLDRSWGQSWLRLGGLISQQTFRLTDGVLETPGPPTGIGFLNTTYRARWYGPEIGLRTTVPIWSLPFTVSGEVDWWPWLKYEGQGIWNRRTDFRQDPSFTHDALGWGVGTDLSLAWWFVKTANVSLGWRWQWMETQSGIDRTFLSNGSVVETGFNGAVRQSQLYYLSAQWRF